MSPGLAQEFPALHFVVGVDADDVLNLREHPDAASPIVATVPPDRRNLEVLRLSENGKWARVGMGERSGWVAWRFLEPETVRDPERLPVPMRCFGSEPFWGLWIPTREFAEFERLPEPERAFDITFQGPSIGGSTRDVAAILTGQNATATLVVRREMCSGSMADRDFGLSTRLVLSVDGTHSFYAGCCSLTGH